MRVALFVSIAAAVQLTACTQSVENPTPTTDEDKTLYSIGAILSDSLAGFDLTAQELAMVKAGLEDGASKEAKLTPEEIDALRPQIQALAEARFTAALERDKATGAEHLAKAAAEAGAQKTDSGMVFKSVTEGSGASPVASDTVKVHYEGKLVDGTVFDSSRENGDEPVTFPLEGVIPCWTEGVQKMKVGGTAKLVCPPELAYGDQGRPPTMPGGATLTFDVELLEIVKADAASGAAAE